MKLFLLRHAQADSHHNDFERGLTQKGCEDAGKLGALMAKKMLNPQYIICSAAKRTQQTLNFLLEGFGTSQNIDSETSQILYNAVAGDILKTIQEQSTKTPLLLVGHNPGIPQLVQILTGENPAQYNPCTLSVIEYSDISQWSDISPGDGSLIEYVLPNSEHLG